MSDMLGRLLSLGKAKLHWQPKICRFGLALLLGVTAVGCSQGSYPLDFFYEMHYQQTYKSHEPPRLTSPEGAVPWFPVPESPSAADGRHLFEVNCTMCHGAGAKGDGPVLTTMITRYGYTPKVTPDLTTLPAVAIPGFLTATTRPFGPDSIMPPFGKLLSPEERQRIGEYIGTLPK